MSKQHPEEESFKDKILNSLNNSDSSNTTGALKDAEKEKIMAQNKDQQDQSESVGSRRSKPAGSSKKPTPKKAKKTENKIEKNIVDSKDPSDVKQRKVMRRKEDRIVNKIVTVVVLALLVIGGILVFSVYRYVSASLRPLDPDSSEKISVEIPSGSSNKAIGEILEDKDVIKSGMVFNYYTKFNNLTGFQAGSYQFSPDMTLDDIGEALQQGGAGSAGVDAKLAIPEGYDIEQIGDAIAKATKIKKEEFIALMKDQAFFDELHKKYPDLLDSAAKAENVRYRLEGYLFPATYDYFKGTSLKEMVTQMVDKSNAVLTPYFETIKEKDMTVQEVLTLASLVEKEGEKEADRKNIAQVFFNRLATDMPLQSDISILYAIGEHKEVVTIAETQTDSPYNLYINTGYGPGPFDSPSEQSIEAVLEPTANNYYYFVADIDTKEVYFAETYEEHMELVEKYVNN
ncbi:endolytic transglycosylase MltG [Enterococcus songbeiensis]|uniref:endolytic transglycosylase MltG n=1 Tax=Enterococcus songbeiensis TaxID=2559927 RepID=UPI0010F8FF15|nr:endolytic transglycosylase MltG [Enterococcus songbeiensis]